MSDSTAATAAEAARSFDALQAQAQQAQAAADAAKAPRPTAAEKLADALKTHAPAPEGYSIRWPKPAFDLLKRDDSAPEDSPAWLVRCNAHGTTTPAKDTRAADKLGTRAGRLTWCKGCKADAAKAARTSRAKAEPKAQETTQA